MRQSTSQSLPAIRRRDFHHVARALGVCSEKYTDMGAELGDVKARGSRRGRNLTHLPFFGVVSTGSYYRGRQGI
jgi:hypothetical protein